jgi:hypothetical protein
MAPARVAAVDPGPMHATQLAFEPVRACDHRRSIAAVRPPQRGRPTQRRRWGNRDSTAVEIGTTGPRRASCAAFHSRRAAAMRAATPSSARARPAGREPEVLPAGAEPTPTQLREYVAGIAAGIAIGDDLAALAYPQRQSRASAAVHRALAAPPLPRAAGGPERCRDSGDIAGACNRPGHCEASAAAAEQFASAILAALPPEKTCACALEPCRATGAVPTGPGRARVLPVGDRLPATCPAARPRRPPAAGSSPLRTAQLAWVSPGSDVDTRRRSSSQASRS